MRSSQMQTDLTTPSHGMRGFLNGLRRGPWSDPLAAPHLWNTMRRLRALTRCRCGSADRMGCGSPAAISTACAWGGVGHTQTHACVGEHPP
jgi:hypothetical protein